MAYESRLSITIDSRTAEQRAEDMQKSLELLERAGVRLTNTNSKVSSSSKNAGSSMGDAGSKAKNGASGVDRINKSLKETDSAAASAAATIRRTLIGAFAGISTIQLYRSTTQQLMAYQDMRTRLTQLVGSSEQYRKEEEYLIQLSKDHHKELVPLADSYVRLISLQKQDILTKDEARKITEGMSNAQSALGVTTEQTGFVIYGLSQALSQGTVQAQELNQVIEPIPGLLDALGRAAGLTGKGVGAQFRKMVTDGKVTSDFLKQTLIKALDEYNGAAAATADNLSAKYRDLSNSYQLLVVAFEKPIVSTLVPVLDSVTEATTYLSGQSTTLSDNLQVVGKVAGGVAAAGIAFYATKSAYATKEIIAKQIAIAQANKSLLLEAQSEQRAAAAIQMSAKQELARANAAVASAEAKVMADKEAQASEIARMRTTQQLMAAENALEVQRIKSQISEIGRQQATNRMAELRLGEVAIAKQIELAEKNLAATTTATSTQVQAAYARRTAAVEAYAVATKAANATAAATERAVAAASLLSRATTGLVGFLTGPVGLAISVGLVAASFIEFSDNATTAKQKAKELASEVEKLTGQFSGLNKVQREVQIAKFNTEMAGLRERIKGNNSEINALNEMIKSTFNESTRFGLIDQIKVLEEENKKLDRQLNEISKKQQAVFQVGLPETKNTTTDGEDIVKQTKKMDKLLERLKDEYAALTLSKEALEAYNVEKLKAQIATSNLSDAEKREAESLVDEIQRRKQAKDALEKQEEAQRNYITLMESLRTDNERLNDTFKKQIEILNAAGLSADQYSNALRKISQSTVSQAPSFGGVDASIGGAAGELIKVNEAQSELDQWRQNELAKQKSFLDQKLGYERQYAERVAEITASYNENMSKIEEQRRLVSRNITQEILGSTSSMFGSMADMSANFAGQQSGLYKTLFAISKSFAIASASLNMWDALSDAMAEGTTVAQKIANYGIVATQMSSIIGNLSSVSMTGFKSGGYTGKMGVNDVAGVVHGDEFVFDHKATRRIGVDNLEALRTGRLASDDLAKRVNSEFKRVNSYGGGNDSGNVSVYVSVNAETGQTEVTGDQSAQYKKLGVMIGNAVRKIIIEEQRPMGLLDKNR
ncbi:tape measure protein [Shewanella algae]|uniref:tape measure protein n=1 Tax=Shewanella algae TaxID=38313 RepID=UPI001AAF9EF7|nr:tape measure protein [Shewanella algae]MBO2582476.1 tape measure protein [Shewanella algae]